jgi:hypothetical protein
VPRVHGRSLSFSLALSRSLSLSLVLSRSLSFSLALSRSHLLFCKNIPFFEEGVDWKNELFSLYLRVYSVFFFLVWKYIPLKFSILDFLYVFFYFRVGVGVRALLTTNFRNRYLFPGMFFFIFGLGLGLGRF